MWFLVLARYRQQSPPRWMTRTGRCGGDPSWNFRISWKKKKYTGGLSRRCSWRCGPSEFPLAKCDTPPPSFALRLRKYVNISQQKWKTDVIGKDTIKINDNHKTMWKMAHFELCGIPWRWKNKTGTPLEDHCGSSPHSSFSLLVEKGRNSVEKFGKVMS